MKKIASFLIAVITTVSVQAQDFQGMAVYESKTSLGDDMMKFGNREITPEMKKMIEARMKEMFEKTFILNFDKTASIYQEEEKLDAPNQDGGRMRMMMSSMTGGGGKHYKNIKDKEFLIEKEIFGKEFLVSDTLPTIVWKMEGESRKIGNYTCYKATASVPVDKSNMMNYRPKKGAEEEMEAKTEEEQKSTNFMDMIEMPTEKIITAWYAPEIPISQGPENYWGLPGLILEVSDGKTTILCSKVVLNVKEKTEIKQPKKGQKVTQTEFEEIMAKKVQEMQEMYGNPGEGRIRTPMGG
ncbi:GLPGLI family protein [Flavobacterium salilacus subsp. salilacus]|uniref:GLPGLI family protein n=1 Tax=Flavobacterium TaxID=237 RepID=UPI0010750375|nr:MULTISPECIES: GLPGLI family protein [Flavobacterium]KAF2516317.1 GLPGLI family protein [Flavobacterium salilacus subsp. salilacus]MBE1613848.1 GLPGLI family protein [Flavobacterium sp. SaA2.13]